MIPQKHPPRPFCPEPMEWGRFRLSFDARTLVMGIVNTTPDSFSDGGAFFDREAAVQQGLRLAAEGADILDIGGESTRPFSDPVSEAEEIRRVVPVIEALAPRVAVPISIDTMKAGVAKAALAAGAAMINDISALRFDSSMADVAAQARVPVVLMHMLGTPKSMQVDPRYTDLVGEIHAFFETAISKATQAGIPRHLLILDPGIGFGKTVAHNLKLLKSSRSFYDLHCPVLIGSSRKAFIRRLLKSPDGPELDPRSAAVATGTQATVAAAALYGAHVVRVHDVSPARHTLAITDALIRQEG